MLTLKVTPAEIAAAKVKLNSTKGVVVTQLINQASNQFKIEGHGVTAEAAYNPTTSELSITIVHKPFFIPEGHLEQSIKAFFELTGIPSTGNSTEQEASSKGTN